MLFVSGHRAPQIQDTDRPFYNLPDDEFVEELRRIGGTPKEVLEHRELMDMIAPVLRADFQLIQTYTYKAAAPLDCPITAYCGKDDKEETCSLMLPWREQSTSGFALRVVPGDHFFLRTSQVQLLDSLAWELGKLMGRSGVN
jgi:medium-chain acyl-[acyl-carrier-protein] hydrolase